VKTTLFAVAGLMLLAASASSAQVPAPPTEHPTPVERPAEPERPARPAVAPHRPAPLAPVHPAGAVAPHPGAPGVVGPGHPAPGGAIAHPGPAAPVEPEAPRYGVTRYAPGTPIDHGFSARNRSHWGWNGRRVHAAGYVFPHGHHYHRCHIGERLPLIFYSEIYYFTDYADYGFENQPDGYEWIRYGPDLLLVDLATGEVVDVEYGVFA
jgi:Ni/Co efflux regulator RcnB